MKSDSINTISKELESLEFDWYHKKIKKNVNKELLESIDDRLWDVLYDNVEPVIEAWDEIENI